jgi:hypothetical protein
MDVRLSLRVLVRRLKEAARSAARSPQASSADRTALLRAAKQLAVSVGNLMKISDQNDKLIAVSPSLTRKGKARLLELVDSKPFAVGGLYDLSGALGAAITLGSLALSNPITRREMEKRLSDIQAQRTIAATLRKRDKVAERDRVILKYAKQVQVQHPKWSRWRIANEIAAPVSEEMRRLSLRKGTDNDVSPVTIHRRLKVLSVVDPSKFRWSDRRSV